MGEDEREAAFAAVADAFDRAELTDEALFAADLNPAVIARQLRERLGDRPALSEPAQRLYQALLAECCDCYVQLVRQLTPFQPRALTELLGRVSGLGEQLRLALARLPVRTLDAPDGDDHDQEFRRRYLQTVSETLDELELFGVDIRRYRPRTSVSVGYISLTVTTADGRRRRGADRLFLEPGRFGRSFNRDRDGEAAVRVESAVGDNQRLLLRGEAGSGKTTLLRWLAVTAARGRFTGELADWNALVPFVVKLRSYADEPLPRPEQFLDGVADTQVDLMPKGWVHRQFDTGSGLLLVDGVDELTAQQRPKVREWLRQLLAAYPQIRVVVTSRPAAAVATWLQAEGFGSATLERMSPTDVRRFIGHWHDAVRHAGGYPCTEQELPRYEAALVGRLDANPHVAKLAASPILCSMLCALNLDRHTHLPRDRMGIYQAALDLLIERREIDRGIPSYQQVSVANADKQHLLRHLAWRMAVNNRAEVGAEDAEHWLADKLKSMPTVTVEPAEVLRHLVERSGVIREPVVGRIDFIHRSLQEYLAAIEAAEQNDLGLLVDRAHQDQWRDTVIMAAGRANVPFRRRLIDELDRRAREESRHGRTLKLLIAACMETMTAPEPAVLSTAERCFGDLLPPRSMRETRSLASVGEPLLRRLPDSLSGLPETQAAALVRTTALVNGPDAIGHLARWALDPRHAVQRELASLWRYFDPEEYADRVLADAPLQDGAIVVKEEDHLPFTWRLHHLTNLHALLDRHSRMSNLDVPGLTSVSLGGRIDDLAPLSRHQGLQSLRVFDLGGDSVVLNSLAELDGIQTLILETSAARRPVQTEVLAQFRELSFLSLDIPFEDLSSLRELSKLSNLFLFGVSFDPNWVACRSLRQLGVHNTHVVGGLGGLVANQSQLKYLRIDAMESTDLAVLGGLSMLEALVIDGKADLSGLAQLTSIKHVELRGGPFDLRPLLNLSGARTVRLNFEPPEADVAAIDGASFEVLFSRRVDLARYRKVAPRLRIRAL